MDEDLRKELIVKLTVLGYDLPFNVDLDGVFLFIIEYFNLPMNTDRTELIKAVYEEYFKHGKMHRRRKISKKERKNVKEAIKRNKKRRVKAYGFKDVKIKKYNHRSKFKIEKSEKQKFYNSMSWRNLRYKIISKHNGKCVLCGKSHKEHGVTMHVDHIIPTSIDWSKRLDENNLQLLCEDCNMGKSNKDSIDWR